MQDELLKDELVQDKLVQDELVQDEHTQYNDPGFRLPSLKSVLDHPGQNRDVREILRNLIGC